MPLTVTDSAARKILSLTKEGPSLFRIMVLGGGCSGFQYSFSLEESMQEDDYCFEEKSVTIIVDKDSLPLLENVQIDYVEELIGASFVVKNPQAKMSCGCGNSFSI